MWIRLNSKLVVIWYREWPLHSRSEKISGRWTSVGDLRGVVYNWLHADYREQLGLGHRLTIQWTLHQKNIKRLSSLQTWLHIDGIHKELHITHFVWWHLWTSAGMKSSLDFGLLMIELIEFKRASADSSWVDDISKLDRDPATQRETADLLLLYSQLLSNLLAGWAY